MIYSVGDKVYFLADTIKTTILKGTVLAIYAGSENYEVKNVEIAFCETKDKDYLDFVDRYAARKGNRILSKGACLPTYEAALQKATKKLERRRQDIQDKLDRTSLHIKELVQKANTYADKLSAFDEISREEWKLYTRCKV